MIPKRPEKPRIYPGSTAKKFKIDKSTLEVVRKLVDFQCSNLKYWFNQALQVGDLEMARVYQNAQNELWVLRQKLTVANLEKNRATYKTYPDSKQLL
jgi:hypothetical protein